ncbi:MAG: putative sulfate exporter family transporter [Chloroflexota bacterium]|nr:putative sulfate exporter family transporter [Chloroflexota bacterium]
MIRINNLLKTAPGLGLCCVIAALIIAITNQGSRIILDPLLVALLLGIVFKNIFPKTQWHNAGTKFAAKFILEFSVMILGASIFFPKVVSAGPGLFGLILCGVVGSMLIAYLLGHIILKLSTNLAILIGVSNSICGNSAAMVIAPIIGASSAELTSVIAISGLLGAAQIILLPLLVPAFGLSEYHYGVVAGMAVYAVAQVYAASATVSAASASVATFVKLVRVVLLAPLVITIQLFITAKQTGVATEVRAENEVRTRGNITLHQYVPWFVIGFIVLAALRSVEIIDEATGNHIREFSRYSFLVAMFAIGLGVDIRDLFNTGAKVALVICFVLLFMVSISVFAGSFLQLQ